MVKIPKCLGGFMNTLWFMNVDHQQKPLAIIPMEIHADQHSGEEHSD